MQLQVTNVFLYLRFGHSLLLFWLHSFHMKTTRGNKKLPNFHHYTLWWALKYMHNSAFQSGINWSLVANSKLWLNISSTWLLWMIKITFVLVQSDSLTASVLKESGDKVLRPCVRTSHVMRSVCFCYAINNNLSNWWFLFKVKEKRFEGCCAFFSF